MKETQVDRLKRIGAISHEEMVDKHIGKKGTKRRDEYEKDLSKEIESLKHKRNL